MKQFFMSLPLLACLCVSTALGAVGMEKFHQKDHGYSIDLPAGWEVKEGLFGTDVIALSPKMGATDAFRDNVNVIAVPIGTALEPKAFFDGNIENLQRVLTQFTLESSKEKDVAGGKGIELIYTHSIGSVKAKVVQLLLLKEDRAYVITCSALADDFDKYKETFQAVIDSLLFDQPAPKKS